MALNEHSSIILHSQASLKCGHSVAEAILPIASCSMGYIEDLTMLAGSAWAMQSAAIFVPGS